MRLQGEDELECAVGVGARGRDVEAEDGLNVVGCEYAIELRAKGLVRLRLRDLSDVVREFELAGCEFARAAFSWLQRTLLQHLSGECSGKASQDGDGGDRLHLLVFVVIQEEDD